MRYLNWDVLLFQGNSRVPLQEFNTKCHVLTDPNNRFIDNAALNCNPHLTEAEPVSQIPVLTSFVSSLEQGSPFRVSVHSWESPKPSQILQTFKTLEETVAFEARLYIDGNMIAHRTFDDSAVWPEVIESTGNADTAHPKPIRFPLFHPEILDQAHWEPGETFGRIKIVIAEGVIERAVHGQSRSPFDRLRDVIAFSFQHAPKRVLEYSGIAWPNARLFRQGLRSQHSNAAGSNAVRPDFESHAHSPRRQNVRSNTTLFEPKSSVIRLNGKRLDHAPTFDDPFVGPTPISLRGKQAKARSNSSEALKDFNSIRTARSHAGTDMSGVSYQKPDFERAINEAAIDEIVQALSPEKRNDLLKALSPSKKSKNNNDLDTYLDNRGNATKKLFGQYETDPGSSPSPMLPRTMTTQQPIALNDDNLFAFRFNSVPSMPALDATHDRRLSHLLRNSFDPVLSVGQQISTPSVNGEQIESAKTSSEARPRSSSIASKRKRRDSLSTGLPGEGFRLSSVSISPNKEDTSPSIGLADHDPASDDAFPGKWKE